MTQETNNEATQSTDEGSGDLFNTAAGWVLFAAGLGLGLSILSDKYFHAYDYDDGAEEQIFVIEVADEGGEEAEMTMAQALNMDGVDVSAGERVFAKCQACHTIEQGGANGSGPNLYGVMGSSKAAKPGFDYSSALSSMGGTWGWDEMNEWLENPRGYVDGTSMGFAGLSKIEDRAAVALYMNSFGSNLPVPEYVAEAAEEAEAEAAAEGEAEAAQDDVEAISEETAAAAE